MCLEGVKHMQHFWARNNLFLACVGISSGLASTSDLRLFMTIWIKVLGMAEKKTRITKGIKFKESLSVTCLNNGNCIYHLPFVACQLRLERRKMCARKALKEVGEYLFVIFLLHNLKELVLIEISFGNCLAGWLWHAVFRLSCPRWIVKELKDEFVTKFVEITKHYHWFVLKI